MGCCPQTHQFKALPPQNPELTGSVLHSLLLPLCLQLLTSKSVLLPPIKKAAGGPGQASGQFVPPTHLLHLLSGLNPLSPPSLCPFLIILFQRGTVHDMSA